MHLSIRHVFPSTRLVFDPDSLPSQLKTLSVSMQDGSQVETLLSAILRRNTTTLRQLVLGPSGSGTGCLSFWKMHLPLLAPELRFRHLAIDRFTHLTLRHHVHDILALFGPHSLEIGRGIQYQETLDLLRVLPAGHLRALSIDDCGRRQPKYHVDNTSKRHLRTAADVVEILSTPACSRLSSLSQTSRSRDKMTKTVAELCRRRGIEIIPHEEFRNKFGTSRESGLILDLM